MFNPGSPGPWPHAALPPTPPHPALLFPSPPLRHAPAPAPFTLEAHHHSAAPAQSSIPTPTARDPLRDPFQQRPQLQEHLASLLENVAILTSIGNELEAIQSLDGYQAAGGGPVSPVYGPPGDVIPSDERAFDGGVQSGKDTPSKAVLREALRGSVDRWPEAASFSSQAAQHVMKIIQIQLDPLQRVLEEIEGSGRVLALKQLGYKRNKVVRNRKWRTKKRRRVAEALRKERERFDAADREADDWRTREIAKVIAKRKLDEMKDLAEKAMKEEKARRQEEMEMVLVIEKLQELRALRILKLKKQGRFFPEEDDLFVERIRIAVEEEERQAAAAANTSAATAAILNAEEARKAAAADAGKVALSAPGRDDLPEMKSAEVPAAPGDLDGSDLDKLSKQDSEDGEKSGPLRGDAGESQGRVSGANREASAMPKAYEGLPAELYQYYYASNFDMGTLIEVRQAWDAFIMPGGSRIPQHWIEAPPPANPIWASYLVVEQNGNRKKKHTWP